MHRRYSNRGFTLVEMLVVIAIIAVLSAIIFPTFTGARRKARQAACMSNMRQLGSAVLLYTGDYDQRYPDSDPFCYSENWAGLVACDPWGSANCTPPTSLAVRYPVCWQNAIFSHVKDNNLYACPASSARQLTFANNATGYAINGAYWRGARKGFQANAHKYAGDIDAPDSASAFDGYRKVTKVQDPSGTLMLMDSSPSGNYQVGEAATNGQGNEHPSAMAAAVDADPNSAEKESVPDFDRHHGGINCTFSDGHVKWQNRDFVYEKSTTNSLDGGTTYVDKHWTMEND